jgi:hypothetical protein
MNLTATECCKILRDNIQSSVRFVLCPIAQNTRKVLQLIITNRSLVQTPSQHRPMTPAGAIAGTRLLILPRVQAATTVITEAAKPVSDPVNLIGAGVLGAFAMEIYRYLRKVARPPTGPLNGAAAMLRAELEQQRILLGNIEGIVNGMQARLAVLEGRPPNKASAVG